MSLLYPRLTQLVLWWVGQRASPKCQAFQSCGFIPLTNTKQVSWLVPELKERHSTMTGLRAWVRRGREWGCEAIAPPQGACFAPRQESTHLSVPQLFVSAPALPPLPSPTLAPPLAGPPPPTLLCLPHPPAPENHISVAALALSTVLAHSRYSQR